MVICPHLVLPVDELLKDDMKKALLFLKENIFSAIGFMIVATSIANFLNYVFNVIAARLLGPERYGEFGALLAILLILTVPSNSIQALVTKNVAEFLVEDKRGAIRELVLGYLKICVYAAFIAIVFFLAFRGILADYLHIDNELPVITCGLAVAVTILAPVFAGVLQGFQRFIWLGIFFMTYALLRMILGALFIITGGGVSGALAGGAVGVMLSIVLAYAVMKDIFSYKPSEGQVDIKKLLRSYLPVIAAFLIFFLITSIDVVIVKRKFDPTLAGEYACATFLGKIVLYFPSAVAIVLYPKFVELQSDRKRIWGLLQKGSWITIAASLSLSAIFIAFPRPTISILYGSEYLGASSILWVFCLAMSGYALINLFIYYFLATDMIGFVIRVLSLAFLLEFIAMYIFASSLFQVAAVHIVVVIIFIAFSIFGMRR